MLRRTLVLLVGLMGLGVLLVGAAVATPSSGVVAETARGELDRPLNVHPRFDNGAKVRIKTGGRSRSSPSGSWRSPGPRSVGTATPART